jgi:hypothetical protein
MYNLRFRDIQIRLGSSVDPAAGQLIMTCIPLSPLVPGLHAISSPSSVEFGHDRSRRLFLAETRSRNRKEIPD